MSVTNPTQDELNDPNFDPIYGYEYEKQQQEGDADAFTLGLAGAGNRTARANAVGTLQQLRGPEYDKTGFTSAGDFNPQDYQNPEAINAQTANDSAEGRAAQLAALQQLSQAQDQSIGSQAALGRYQAQQDAGQLANSREQAIKQDAMRRGRVGGAADMIGRQQAAQGAANMNLNAGMQTAQMAALQRLQGIQGQGQLAGQLRGQDQSLAFKNADILNAANSANVGARNATRAGNVDLHNSAAKGNLANRQQIRNANTQRGDDIVNSKYAAASGKANSVANALGGFATGQGQTASAQQSAGGQILKSILSAYGAGKAGEEVT